MTMSKVQGLELPDNAALDLGPWTLDRDGGALDLGLWTLDRDGGALDLGLWTLDRDGGYGPSG